jgi:uncharacterized Zn finger protein (UPF0148 family)
MRTITCERCGRQHVDERGTTQCTLCGAQLPGSSTLNMPREEEPRRPAWPSSRGRQNQDKASSSRDYQAAHIPAREEAEPLTMNQCPDCGARTIRAEGCCSCVVCGWSACSS